MTDNWGQTPLNYAVKYGHKDLLDMLQPVNCGFFRVNSINLELAAANGHIEVLRHLLDAGDTAGIEIALCAASENGQLEATKVLLSASGLEDMLYNTNIPKHGRTALILATINRHVDVVRLLLANGADAAVTDDLSHGGKSALQHAIKTKSIVIAKLLLSHGADVNSTDSRGQSALFDSVES